MWIGWAGSASDDVPRLRSACDTLGLVGVIFPSRPAKMCLCIGRMTSRSVRFLYPVMAMTGIEEVQGTEKSSKKRKEEKNQRKQLST